MYTSQGRDALAEKTVASALDMARSTLPKDHWLIGKCMTHVAAVSTHQGEYDKAETMFIAALQLLRRSLPANHPELASGINQFGELYQVQQRFELAEYVSSTSPAHDLLHFAAPCKLTHMNSPTFLAHRSMALTVHAAPRVIPAGCSSKRR